MRDIIGQGGDDPATGFVAHAERCCDLFGEEGRVAQRTELDDPGPAWKRPGNSAGGSQCEPRFAYSAGTDKGHEPGMRQARR